MTTTTIQPGTVIHDTLRECDLIPAFVDLLRSMNPDRARQLLLDFDIRGPWPDDEHDFWFTEDCVDLLNALFDELDERGRPDYYFGAHPSDGSDFGYWECDMEDC